MGSQQPPSFGLPPWMIPPGGYSNSGFPAPNPQQQAPTPQDMAHFNTWLSMMGASAPSDPNLFYPPPYPIPNMNPPQFNPFLPPIPFPPTTSFNPSAPSFYPTESAPETGKSASRKKRERRERRKSHVASPNPSDPNIEEGEVVEENVIAKPQVKTQVSAKPVSGHHSLPSRPLNPQVVDKSPRLSDREEGECFSQSSPSNSKTSQSPYNPPSSVSANTIPTEETDIIPFGTPEYEHALHLRVQAQGALLSLYPHGIGYDDLVAEGCDPHILARLYADVGLKISPPQAKQINESTKTSKPSDKKSSVEISSPTQISTQPAQKRSPVTSTKPPVKSTPVPRPVDAITTPTSDSGKPMERKDFIAKMLAANAAKALASKESSKENTKSTSTPATPSTPKPAIDSPIQAPREKNKAQTELARKRMQELQLKLQQQKAQQPTQPALKIANENHPSLPSVPPRPVMQFPLPARPQGLQSPDSTSIPGLFLTESQQDLHLKEPSIGIQQQPIDATSVIRTSQRKRPIAADFDQPTSASKRPLAFSREPSRPSSAPRLVIDISDDEYLEDDDEGYPMDLSPPPEGYAEGVKSTNSLSPPVKASPASTHELELAKLRLKLAEAQKRQEEKRQAQKRQEEQLALLRSKIPLTTPQHPGEQTLTVSPNQSTSTHELPIQAEKEATPTNLPHSLSETSLIENLPLTETPLVEIHTEPPELLIPPSNSFEKSNPEDIDAANNDRELPADSNMAMVHDNNTHELSTMVAEQSTEPAMDVEPDFHETENQVAVMEKELSSDLETDMDLDSDSDLDSYDPDNTDSKVEEDLTAAASGEDSDSYEPDEQYIEAERVVDSSSNDSDTYEPPEAATGSDAYKNENSQIPSTTQTGTHLPSPAGSTTDEPLMDASQMSIKAPTTAHQLGNASSSAFTPYVSPLERFKSYRRHWDFENMNSGDYRSIKYSNNLNVDKFLCDFELAGGVCNDRSCEYQHFRDLALSDHDILIQLGALSDIEDSHQSDEVKKDYIAGLKLLINSMRQNKVHDFNDMAHQIAAYRRRVFFP